MSDIMLQILRAYHASLTLAPRTSLHVSCTSLVLTMNTRAVRGVLVLIVMLSIGAAPAAHCQTSFQTWPELDLTWKMADGWALYVPISFNGKRETDNREATAGASIERHHNRI